MTGLPDLKVEELAATRDNLQQVCLVLSSLQRALIPKHPRQWQYGLEVNMRGLATQPFEVNNQTVRATLDLVSQKMRLGKNKWPLRQNPPAQILANVKGWLASQGANVTLDEPEFTAGTLEYDPGQAAAYAHALWWMEQQFQSVKSELASGVTAPILLYPHHFDLSLVWFPWDDERQLAIGWSTGDETITEPYIYLTAYPEPAGFTSLDLPPPAYWQKESFSAAILPYSKLKDSPDPTQLFQEFVKLIPKAKPLI